MKFFNKRLFFACFLIDNTIVTQYDFQIFRQEGHFSQALFQNIKFKYRSLLKNCSVRLKGYGCTCFIRIAVSRHLQGIAGLTSFISLFVNFTFLINGNFQPVRKGVYNRSTHTMQPTGYLISAAAEFAACMQYGKYHFHCGNTRFMIDAHRNAASIIFYCYGIIFIDCHNNFITKTSKCFVNGIIHNLIHKMMKSSCRSASNVHTGPFSDCFKSLQYLNLVCSVFRTHISLLNHFITWNINSHLLPSHLSL